MRTRRIMGLALKTAGLLAAGVVVLGACVERPAGPARSDVARALVPLSVAPAKARLGETLRDPKGVAAAYEAHDGNPLWVGRPAAEELLATLQHAADDGLDPAAYHADAITARLSEKIPERWAEADVLLTDGYL